MAKRQGLSEILSFVLIGYVAKSTPEGGPPPTPHVAWEASEPREDIMRKIDSISVPSTQKSPTNLLNIMKKSIAIFLILLTALPGCAPQKIKPSSPQAISYEHRKPANKAEIAALFDRWNQMLQTADPGQVVALYAERSILLPTLSNKPRLTPEEKKDYFRHFLENRPFGRIDLSEISIDGNMAVDSGLYTFTFAATGEVVRARYTFTYRWDGSRWLIVSHHSSLMPE